MVAKLGDLQVSEVISRWGPSRGLAILQGGLSLNHAP